MTSSPAFDNSAEARETQALLEAVRKKYGYDFLDYARSSITRRVLYRMEAEGLSAVSCLQERLMADSSCMERLLCDFSINTTAMFRDPGFWRVLRAEVLPLLKTYPHIRVWDVGCSTGEELWSLAILMEEEGILPRVRLYATDFNEVVLKRAREGIFPLSRMKEFTENYHKAGGTREFSSYFTAKHNGARFDPRLLQGAVLAQHNLVTDKAFNEFQLILCRNVMIYFNRTLQDRVYSVIHESLVRLGVLGLGDKESLRFSPHADCYEPLDERQKIFRRAF